MKKFFAVMAAAAVCILATGCLQQAQQLPLEDITPTVTPPSAEQTTPDNGSAAPETGSTEDKQPDLTLDCGDWTVTLPGQYTPLLLPSIETESTNGRQPLVSVYEKTSVEEAKRDMGDSGGMGFLFGITMLEGTAYQDWLNEGFPGYTLFARDDAGRYFFRVEATDVRFYRSDYSKADPTEWNALMALAEPTCQQFITINGLTPYTRTEALAAASPSPTSD